MVNLSVRQWWCAATFNGTPQRHWWTRMQCRHTQDGRLTLAPFSYAVLWTSNLLFSKERSCGQGGSKKCPEQIDLGLPGSFHSSTSARGPGLNGRFFSCEHFAISQTFQNGPRRSSKGAGAYFLSVLPKLKTCPLARFC